MGSKSERINPAECQALSFQVIQVSCSACTGTLSDSQRERNGNSLQSLFILESENKTRAISIYLNTGIHVCVCVCSFRHS